MLHGLTKVIGQASRHVPETLWAPRQVERMRALAERFPAVSGRTVGAVRLGVMGLEMRLAAGADQVDLLFIVLAEDRDAILALAADEADGAWMRADPHWSRIVELCRRWADPASLLGRHVDLLWFEFDVDGGGAQAAVPVPGIFVGFKPATTRETDGETWRSILGQVVECLAGAPPRPALADRFAACVAAVPQGAYVHFIGMMLSRGAGAVRLVVAGTGDAQIPGYLAEVGWPGAADGLGETLAAAAGAGVHTGAASLQVDVADRVLPRIGLEYPFDREAQVRGRFAERRFLDRMVEMGLCDPAKRDALLALPGETTERRESVGLEVGHARQVHHVKLVVDPGGVVEAKAYYGQALTIRRIEPAVHADACFASDDGGRVEAPAPAVEAAV
ncbi:MAG: hypothetical protein JWM27_3442 [Gemmatimonadetes bacterium]|nr:hypothetical protein [Gemmatimonadota bacterium]